MGDVRAALSGRALGGWHGLSRARGRCILRSVLGNPTAPRGGGGEHLHAAGQRVGARRILLRVCRELPSTLSKLLDVRRKLLDASPELLGVRRKLLDASRKLLDASSKLLDARPKLLDASRKLLEIRRVLPGVVGDVRRSRPSHAGISQNPGGAACSAARGILDADGRPAWVVRRWYACRYASL